MWRIVLLFALLAGSLPAQIPSRPDLLPATLVNYLELTESQQAQLLMVRVSWAAFGSQKALRSAQVQAEIQAELRKADPDPMALGVRYREIEAIRRETAAEQERTLQTAQAILTAAQKQKISTLRQALLLQAVACDSITWNLSGPPVMNTREDGSYASAIFGLRTASPCTSRWVDTNGFTTVRDPFPGR
jgi:hypothetical protein